MIVYLGVALFILLTILNVIPSSQPVSNPIFIAYPHPKAGEEVMKNINNTMIIQLEVSANETIAERKPVKLSAVGSMGNVYARSVSFVEVGFKGTYPYYPNGEVLLIGNPFFAVLLFPTSIWPPHVAYSLGSGGAFLAGGYQIVEWRAQGNYYPTIVVHFTNGSLVEESYPEFPIYVESTTVAQGESNTRIELAATIALVVFAVFDLRDISKLIRKEPRRKIT
jgi:hypothetical protein